MDSDTLQVLNLDPRRPDSRAIDRAACALTQGLLVILPTETVYGIAADPRVDGAVEKLYPAKGRPEGKPLPILVADAGQIEREGGRWNVEAGRLADAFWPGPLTIVLETAGGTTGFRVPDHQVVRMLLRALHSGLAVTSANRSGEPPALSALDAARAVGAHAALVLDAGPSPGGVPSTVVRVTSGEVEVLREGAIHREEIFQCLKS